MVKMTIKNKFNINRMDAHHKLYASLALAAICFAAAFGRFSGPVLFMITWLTYALSSLTLSALTIFNVHPADFHREAHAQDSSRTFVFGFAIFASLASLLAILILLKGTSSNNPGQLTLHVLLSLACVVSSWILVHTIFTFRYAHFYYCDIDRDEDGQNPKPGGLQFPDDEQPDYLDFSYFAFVIGMTFQVSDVQISSKKIRRLGLLHGLLSFAFNTIIVALSINIVAGLIQK
jgi:uncharacterized membrane protein